MSLQLGMWINSMRSFHLQTVKLSITHGERINIEREIRGEHGKQKKRLGGSQTMSRGKRRQKRNFYRCPTRRQGLELEPMEWKSGERGWEAVWASLLSVKAVSVRGVPVGEGQAALCAKLAGTSSLKFQPSTSPAKISSQFCALARLKRGATEGARGKHSHHSLGDEGEGESMGLGWEEAQAFATESRRKLKQ